MTQPGMEFRFPPDHGHLRVLRREVRKRLGGFGVSEARVDMVLLVLDEIVTNSIEHAQAYRQSAHLLVRLGIETGAVTLEFEDPDVPDETVAALAQALDGTQAQPAAHFERGRGLFLIAGSVDDLSIALRKDGGLHLSGRVSGELA